MRHRRAGRRLGVPTDRRIALLRGLASAMLLHEAIKTTEPRAKELRRFVERRPNDIYCSFCLGAFLYRQGKDEEARPWIERSMGSGVNDQGQHAYGRFVLAMIAARENRPDDAQRLLIQGEKTWRSAGHQNWRFQLVNQTLHREAERVVAAQNSGKK